jgi:iron complex outermembrane recepter protein
MFHYTLFTDWRNPHPSLRSGGGIKMRINSARSLLLASVGAVAFQAAPAAAQEPVEKVEPSPSPATSEPSLAEDGARQTDTIIVTARRVVELLQDVPASVSAFDDRALDRLQAKDLTDLQGAVPNLNIVQGRGSSNATNIFIRGVGQPDALQTFDPAVGVYVDDVYLSRIRGAQLDMLDVERIEVLRGPQGTLYGKNTIGGAIKFVTRRPGQDVWAKGSVEIGSYDQLTLKGAASGPLTDTVAVGVAAMLAKRDGFVEDRVLDRDYNDKDTIGARASVAFTPSAAFRLDVSADYTEDDAALNVGAPVNELTYLTLFAPVNNLLLPLEQDLDDYDYTARISPGLPNSTKLKHWGTSARAEWDITPALTFRSITAYRELKTDDYIDIDATQLRVGDVFVGVDQNQFSQEFQLLLNRGRLQGVAGLYYLGENINSHQEAYADDLVDLRFLRLIAPLIGLPLALLGPSDFPTFLRTVDDDLETDSYAAYANATYSVTDALRVSAGIRYTKETKDYFRTTSTFSSSPILNGTFAFNASDSWTDVSPMASVDYHFTPDTMAYVRVAKGFKSGGFNGRANNASETSAYDPETVWSYEAGLRTHIAHQLRLSATVFHNDYKDFQARVSGIAVDPVSGIPEPTLGVLNAGKMRIRGAELEAAWTPVRQLLLDAQIGYLDAQYEDFEDDRFTNFGGSRAFQMPAFAPKWTVRFGGQYSFDLGGSGTLLAGAQYRYRSRHALSIDNTLVNSAEEIEGLFEDGFDVVDARVVWEDPAKRFTVGLYGQNLFEEVYKTDGQEFSSVGNIRTVYFGAPRTFTLRLTARY